MIVGFAAMELAPGVHSLGDGTGGHVRAFLFDDGGELTLVDTLFQNDAHLVLEQIDRLGRRIGDLKRIAITHGHRSHLGGLAALKRASGARVYAHEWEADIVAGDRRAQPIGVVPQSLRLVPFQLGLRLDRPKHVPCPVDEVVSDDDAVGPLQVVHAPGHSPGHLAFLWPERRVLVAGDAIATWPSFSDGWKGFHLNLAQHAVSLRRLAALDARIVGVGHGDPITHDAAERVHSLVA
jgi:glyoxylase-like metal-dependent hydrolase (beta-lactamase superfamily II)